MPTKGGRRPFPLRGPEVKRRIETVNGPVEIHPRNGVPKRVGQAWRKIDGSVGRHEVGLKLKRDRGQSTRVDHGRPRGGIRGIRGGVGPIGVQSP